MRRDTFVGIALVITVGASLSAQSPNPGHATGVPVEEAPLRPVFKSGVELVGLSVIVTDKHERYVSGLDRGDFQVFEDGVQQDLSFFANGDAPLDLAILLDTSASMGDKIEIVREAAIGFARHLHPQDRAAVIAFHNTVDVAQPLTGNAAALDGAISRTTAQGATALYNAVYVALKDLARQAKQLAEVRRQAIVVLSDGQDTASLISFDDVLDLSRRSGVAIYAISLKSTHEARRIRTGVSRPFFSVADYEMNTLARETGARSYFPLEIAELKKVYGAIADELSSQYSIGYVSRNVRQDGKFRRVVVRLSSRPDAQLRTRTGYFAPRPPSGLSR